MHRNDISHSLTALLFVLFFFPVGLEEKLDNINQLKVKGLVLGPLHTVQSGRPETLDLKMIDANQGNKEELLKVIEKAARKGSLFSGLK